MRFLFVLNPVSGGKQKQDWEAAIRNYFQNLLHDIQFYILAAENNASSIQHHIDTFQPQCVVAVGGDGTIKAVAELLKGTDIILGILPAGSANGMAKELNIPTTPDGALHVLVKGSTRKIDLILLNNTETCIHLSDIGLNAMVVKYFEKYKGRGWLSYGRALLKVLWQKQKFSCTIKTDSGVLKRSVYMIVIANATKYGMGAVINPVGELDDGAFEIIIVRKLNVFAVINGLFRGKPFHPEKIEIIKTTALEITTRRKHHFQVDGEYLGKHKILRAAILPKALNVLVPS